MWWRAVTKPMTAISIIIPAFNEADNIVATLQPLQPLRQQGHEIVIADGGSDDATIELARPLADHLINTPKGRARQMNAGAHQSSGEVLLFLHADTLLPGNAVALIQQSLQSKQWGRFDVRLTGQQPLLRAVELLMNWRSQLSGIATGDQAIFIKHELFEHIGGYADIPLMEDIAISKVLNQHGRPACIKTRLTTSSRRWEQNGIIKTILLMWRLRLAYFFGAKPEQLARLYR